jgi:endonuclease I
VKHRLGCTGLICIFLSACWEGATVEDQVREEVFANKSAPTGYYDAVDDSSGGALHKSLHDIIDDHKRFSYAATWGILELADEIAGNKKYIRDIYQNAIFKKVSSNRPYNREHVWPKSIGFPQSTAENVPFTDCHHLFLVESSYNSARNNKPFRDCADDDCEEFPTENGDFNLTMGAHTAGTWETWSGRRGDVARALFYMAVRYDGGQNAQTKSWEPDLRLTDDESLWIDSETDKNEKIAYMGSLSTLLAWHAEDPVDDAERQHNQVVFGFQGNRNPFVDHPEWVACVFENDCDLEREPAPHR